MGELTIKGYKLESKDLSDRLMSKVTISGESECWIWTGAKNPKSYGRLAFRIGGKQIKLAAHRLSYLLKHSADPADKLVCHTCDNPGCINPSHLYLGTVKDNNKDCRERGRYYNVGAKGRKLTEYQVKQIKQQLVCEKVNYSRIAKEYGVNPGTIHSIHTGKSWC